MLEDFLRLFPLLFSATQNARFCQAITSSFERRQWNRLSKGLRNAAKMAMDKVNVTFLYFMEYYLRHFFWFIHIGYRMIRTYGLRELFVRQMPVNVLSERHMFAWVN